MRNPHSHVRNPYFLRLDYLQRMREHDRALRFRVERQALVAGEIAEMLLEYTALRYDDHGRLGTLENRHEIAGAQLHNNARCLVRVYDGMNRRGSCIHGYPL